MLGGIAVFVGFLVCLVVFGAIGMRLGEKLDERGFTSNADAALFWIFGVGGVFLVVGIIHLMGWW